MKSISFKFLFISFLLINGLNSNAQVLTQDSLALVSFYNSTNGDQWFRKTNWLTTRVGLWEGVGILGNRVHTLALVTNNLVGTIPDEFCDLSGLEYIYLRNNQLTGNIPSCIGNAVSINSLDLSNNNLSGTFPSVFATAMPRLADIWITNNQFTDFPDLSGVPELSNLHVDGNKLTFEDIIPNTFIPNMGYVYSPQSIIDQSGADVVVDIFDPFTLQVIVGGGINNAYQWKLNSVDVIDHSRFTGTTTSTLTNTGALVDDEGIYSCFITNPAAPLLTLQVMSSAVQVTDNRISQILSFPSDTSIFCGSDSIIVPANTQEGFPATYTIIEGDAVAIDDANRIYARAPGSAKIRVFNSGDAIYQSLEDTILVNVSTHFAIPSFSIEHDLPIYEGEELVLSVVSIPGLTYQWVTPDLQNEQTASISRPSGANLVEGIYKVQISEGTCLYDTLEISVSFAQDDNVVIYELITPNGDGDNETFFIKNLEALPSVDVTIFNVWHQVVYNDEKYENNWDGGGLPVGTYYYLVKIKDWGKVYKGNLLIKR